MAQSLYLVDAFTDGPFSGNPAGVCPLEGPAEASWMQDVAAEMNQAETAFFYPRGDGYHLRWFTPTVEVDLCGHATLASAHVLFHELGLDAEVVSFETRSGTLQARKLDHGIELDFPAEPVVEAPLPFIPACLPPLVASGKNRMDWFVEVESDEAVFEMEPDFAEIERLGMRGLIVTALGLEPDYISRFFAPQSGVPEDHVTGSAHCALGPYWSAKLGRAELMGCQVSKRGGSVLTVVNGDRVKLIGSANTFLKGTLA